MASRIRTVLDSTATMAGRIRTVLGPRTAESPEFQHWCKKMFTLKSINNQLLICREGKPIAIREKLFIILARAHQQCQHGDLHKTSLEVERIYFKIPHNLINEFIKLCPICWNRTPRSPAEDISFDVINFDRPETILFYLKHFEGGSDPAPTTSMPPPRQSQFHYESDGSVQIPSFNELIATLPEASRQKKTADDCCSEMEVFRQERVGAASRGLCEDLGWTQQCRTRVDATTKISTQPHREDSPSGREPWGVFP
ncbi:hypothetical protein PAAG_12634 [Paracoccidioides lutzii Pb01]|uniref:Integrase zinc-binding domain-containing protein n=1 Tax=Paracoccidioides lutzii (strain ATCC MYA-826 / Pb01) TaxID=502779 RepID=A0A0A2UYS2_PARBA|nr:hypothetical protein PAAG_12634 [Paracoccidioides lutzii Pb01]KGQ00701.1 hypothetical protein PAAG_12634 [Paracoccidioides lutzii Pb01]